jgi:DNA-binding NarL/FixJ family response regulator
MSSTKPITVSLVEDQPEVRDQIIGYLEGAPGLQCRGSYACAEEALQNVPSQRPDVLLMDINLGGTSGIECTRRLKLECPEVQILMLTVFEDSENIYEALAAGASGYLLKRMPPAKLIEAIREVHEGGSPMSAPIARKVVTSFRRQPAGTDERTSLTSRERDVLELLAKGCTYKFISSELNISVDTIRTHIRHIYEKLHVHSRTEAVAKYVRPS